MLLKLVTCPDFRSSTPRLSYIENKAARVFFPWHDCDLQTAAYDVRYLVYDYMQDNAHVVHVALFGSRFR